VRDHLEAYFAEHHKLVETDALQLLLQSPQPLVLSRRVLEALGPDDPMVSYELVAQLASFERAPSAPRPLDGTSLGPAAPEPAFRLLREGFQPAPGVEPLAGYSRLFHFRYETMARFLKGRPDLPNVHPVAELARAEGTVSVLAMVRDVRQTPEKHHLIVRLEDPSGAAEVLVLKDSVPARTPFLPDEVVGAKLKLTRERVKRIPLVEGVVRPDVPLAGPRRGPAPSGRVLFLSDLHIGSRSFLDGPWGALVEFLAGRGPRPEVAREIEHVVVAGDLVDGIGIYPNQERDLAVHDIIEQYRLLGRRLAELPARLDVIVVPGNHDAVCPAEPQPALPEEIRRELPERVRSLGNPSTFALSGVVIEAYHGRSFDDLIPAIPGASYARPTEVMKRMLQMRHLAPIYGGRTPLAPLARDGLIVDPPPQILVTGHAHTFGADRYRGVLLLNASTWQAETDYQRMRNITPVPGQAAVVDLRDLGLTRLDFASGELAAPMVPA
jgi:DNA polymerase II small subunit